LERAVHARLSAVQDLSNFGSPEAEDVTQHEHDVLAGRKALQG
jgi:hypothetical protein